MGSRAELGWWDVKDGVHTIGSCETGLGPVFTLVSAAVPPAFIVYAVLLLFIQVMYCARGKWPYQQFFCQQRSRWEDAYRVVGFESRFVLEPVYGVPPAVELTTVAVYY